MLTGCRLHSPAVTDFAPRVWLIGAAAVPKAAPAPAAAPAKKARSIYDDDEEEDNDPFAAIKEYDWRFRLGVFSHLDVQDQGPVVDCASLPGLRWGWRWRVWWRWLWWQWLWRRWRRQWRRLQRGRVRSEQLWRLRVGRRSASLGQARRVGRVRCCGDRTERCCLLCIGLPSLTL
jgi:hypothetical protein